MTDPTTPYCPKHPNTPMQAVQYRGTTEDYDGTSEWACAKPDCAYRVGRWTNLTLPSGLLEPRYGGHRVVAAVAKYWLEATSKRLDPVAALVETRLAWSAARHADFLAQLCRALQHHIGGEVTPNRLRRWLRRPHCTYQDCADLAQWAISTGGGM